MDEGARNADAEIAAIFTRLKAEVRKAGRQCLQPPP